MDEQTCKDSYYCRDTIYSVTYLDFKFAFPTPRPRKERWIVARDKYGRITESGWVKVVVQILQKLLKGGVPDAIPAAMQAK